MNKKRVIILYGLFLLIPSLIGGVFAWRLLSHEQERINNNAMVFAQNNAKTIAGSISLTVETMERVVLKALSDIPPDKAEETLGGWVETNPLIRNFFIWHPDKRFIYPVSGLESITEERLFIKRFERIFVATPPWESTKPDEASGPDPVSVQNKQTRGDRSYLPKMSRSQLFDLASEVKQAPEKESKRPGGWYPCFTEDRLHIIGWVKDEASGRVIGVELELVTILSRIITDLSNKSFESGTYALLNGHRKIIHQTGSTPIADPDRYEYLVPVSTALPHWSVAVYIDQGAFKQNRVFFYGAMCLVILFFAGITGGGGFLVWLTGKNMRDAREKTSFVSSVSHELKTPLTSIRMYAELLQSGRVTAPEKKSRYLSVIVSETERLTRLINNVLDFSRLEQDKKEYNQQRFDLAEFVREVVAVHTLRINNAGLAVSLQIPDGPFEVVTDRDCLAQIVLNIIDNAIKYAADGKKLTLCLTDEPETYRIEIGDHGDGIPPSQKEKIFEKFHRIDNSLTGKQSGSGLGLCISRSLMRDMGGDVHLDENTQKGSLFIVTIPKGKWG